MLVASAAHHGSGDGQFAACVAADAAVLLAHAGNSGIEHALDDRLPAFLALLGQNPSARRAVCSDARRQAGSLILVEAVELAVASHRISYPEDSPAEAVEVIRNYFVVPEDNPGRLSNMDWAVSPSSADPTERAYALVLQAESGDLAAALDYLSQATDADGAAAPELEVAALLRADHHPEVLLNARSLQVASWLHNAALREQLGEVVHTSLRITEARYNGQEVSGHRWTPGSMPLRDALRSVSAESCQAIGLDPWVPFVEIQMAHALARANELPPGAGLLPPGSGPLDSQVPVSLNHLTQLWRVTQADTLNNAHHFYRYRPAEADRPGPPRSAAASSRAQSVLHHPAFARAERPSPAALTTTVSMPQERDGKGPSR
ncbi:hypothetical protein [Streptacidiphilus sp. MAP5-52]|uniref:hypothetical protein n=1 Tax=Streptacidiphilus sp. MAP5-52 TaxID=3156267 RepID=UPI003517678A